MANSFFKNGDKAYSENLNDGILVGNAFDWTVSIGLPADNGGVFPNSSTVVKAKVADVSITPNSNLSIGSSIENSSGSSQVYRLTVYPDFNRFGGFKSITLEGDGTFYIANKGANTPIANNLDYTDLSDVPELKVLKEYDIVVTIPNNGEVTGLEFVFQSSSANVSGSINPSNVSGLNNTITAIQEKDTEQDGRLLALEEVNSDIYYYNLMSSDFNPNINDEIIITCRVKTVTGEDVEGKTATLYKNGSSVGTSTTSELGVASWTVTCDDWGLQDFRVANTSIQVNVTGWKTVAQDTWYTLKTNGEFVELSMFGSHTVNISTSWATALTIANDTYRPQQPLVGMGYNQTLYQIKTNGDIQIVRFNGSATTTNAAGTYYWKLK